MISLVNVKNAQDAVDLFKFTKEIYDGKLHCMCSVRSVIFMQRRRNDSRKHLRWKALQQ